MAVVAYVLGLALASEHLQLSLEVGAVAAGLLMTYTPYARQAESTLEPLMSLFGGMYLASLGMIINPRYILAHFGELALWCLVVVAVKFAAAWVALKRLGAGDVAAYAAGFSLAQVSEVGLYLAGKARRRGLLGRHAYLLAAALCVALLAASPFASHALRHVNDVDLDFSLGETSTLFKKRRRRRAFWDQDDEKKEHQQHPAPGRTNRSI